MSNIDIDAGSGATDHGALTGLSDDDHAQYALLAGRSTGQILFGGTAASENLTLRSTSHSTKGNIIIGDQGGHLQIGGGTSASEARFMEPSGSGTNYSAFKAQAQAGNVTYTLPAADGSSGQFLSTNGSGSLSWSTVNSTPSSLAVSSNITLVNNTVHLVDTSSIRTLTLPTPVAGIIIYVKDALGSASTNNITIARAASEKIEGISASYAMSTNWGSLTIFSNGTDWFFI